jgi:subfamily B ATP-binding cassette protein MsbA
MLYRLQPQVQQLDNHRTALQAFTGSVDEVLNFLDCQDKTYIQSGSMPFWHLQSGIAFKQVNFVYSAESKTALQDISMQIPCNQTTALVGPSGAGKSTLVNLICRFYDVTSGEILVDGQPLPRLDLRAWRDRIAIVSQDIFIFNATIAENIAYGRRDASRAEIIAAAQQANAHEFISQMPQGYDTPVGDRGVRLSGGQRQRIALARAIIRNPEILILDEATNALDSISESIIQDALEKLSHDRTVIIIAHRLSTIEFANQVIVLENGQIVEQGKLSELIERQGLLHRLYQLQYKHVHPQLNILNF